MHVCLGHGAPSTGTLGAVCIGVKADDDYAGQFECFVNYSQELRHRKC